MSADASPRRGGRPWRLLRGWRRGLALLAGAAALALLAGAAFVTVQWQRRPDLGAYRPLTLPAAGPASPGALRVRFAGVSTLVFDDGETAWMTDGFFSRPGAWPTFTGRIAPDPAAVDAALQRLGVQRLAAVVPLHAHYDHALDAPLVARRTGALLVGSPSVRMVGLGQGLPDARIRVVRDGERVQLGRFTLRFIASRHSPTPLTDGLHVDTIDAPLVPPARADAWATGETWSLLVHHGGRSLLVQASAGFRPGALAGQRAETVLLGIGTLGRKDAAYRDAYWRETVAAVGARRVLPIHWDDFWQPLPAGDAPLAPMPRLLDDVDGALDDLRQRGATAGVALQLAPLWQPFDPFAPAPAAAAPSTAKP